MDGLYFQFDSWQGIWTPATATGGGGFTATAAALYQGPHILYAYATDGQDATSAMTTEGGGSSPLTGAISSYLFLVDAATLKSISIVPASPTVRLGSTLQFTANGSYNDGSIHDITESVNWSSSNDSVATIGSAGLAIGVGLGTTTIGAALNGVSGSTTLTVGPGFRTPPPPTALDLR